MKDQAKNTPIIKRLLEAGKCILGKSSNKKHPITLEIVKQLVTCPIIENVNPSDLRDITMFVIGFCGFLRCNEIVNIKRSDITFHENYVTIFLEKSKTDKYKEGANVYLAKLNNITCPHWRGIQKPQIFIQIRNLFLGQSLRQKLKTPLSQVCIGETKD